VIASGVIGAGANGGLRSPACKLRGALSNVANQIPERPLSARERLGRFAHKLLVGKAP